LSLSLDGRVALVTGASRGLGRAEALALARRGARVVVVDVLDASETVALIEEAGGSAVHAQIDLSTGEAGAQQALDVALAAHGDLHVLVNNAGVMRDRMSFNLSEEDWDLVLAVNLSATFQLARAATRLWRERRADGDEQPRAIVNTSSESGLYGNAGQANYSAAKAGVAALTITLATELDRLGVRVNAIAPRARTPMTTGAFGELAGGDAAHDPYGPEHIAEVVAWLVSDAAHDVTGQVLVVHGGGVQAMRTWTPVRELPRDGAWSDDELLALRERLFPDDDARRLAEPIGDLFALAGDDAKEAVR
jgi:NAD(P)-dependent dehydrogenase (short-subunit alcohol dehydrogenase family)